MNNDTLTSFRGFRDQNDENSEHLEQINKLNDIQTATELVAETVENKSNDIVNSVDDNTAINEVNAENTQQTAENTGKSVIESKKLNAYASQINDKLGTFSSMLGDKFGNLTTKVTSGLSAIEDALKVETPEPTIQNPQTVLPELPSNVPTDSYQGFQRKQEDDKRKDKDSGKRERDPLRDDIQALVKAVRGGFKQTVGISNQILGTLFKISLTAMAEMIKWGAILLSLILAIDTIKIHLKYWGDLFNNNFSEFLSKSGEWAASLTKLLKTTEQARDFWTKRQYGDLIITLVKGLGEAFYEAIIQLDRIVTTGIANILRSIPGMGDLADELEYGALMKAYQHGYKPTERESALMATYEEKERTKFIEEYRDYDPDSRLANMFSLESKESKLKKRDESRALEKERAGTTEKQRIESRKEFYTLDSVVNQSLQVMESLDDSDIDKLEVLNDQANQIRQQVEESPILLETDKQAILDKLEDININYQRALNKSQGLMPENPAETETGRQVERTEQAQLQQLAQSSTTHNTANVNNTQVINSQKIIRQGDPITSTPAAGFIQKGVV